MKYVLLFACLVLINLMLIAECDTRRTECVDSPACICRSDGSMCWDQRSP